MFLRLEHFWATVCKTVRPMLSVRCLSTYLSVTFVHCGQTAGWMKVVLGMEVGLCSGDFVLDGDPVPFPKKGAKPPPQFLAHFYCGKTAQCIKMPLGMDVGLNPGDFVLDGDPVLSPNKGGGAPSQFSVHFYCAQTAGYIKMPLGMEVGLSSGEFVLDGDPAPLTKRGRSPFPNFMGLG